MPDLNQVSDDLVIEAWIRYQTQPLREDRDSDFWAVERLIYAVFDDPDWVWSLILRILDRDSSDDVKGILSAGALEDILTEHGDRFIDRVEEEAKRDPEFASLLGGVWQSSMSDEMYARVQRVWNRSGWDGNP